MNITFLEKHSKRQSNIELLRIIAMMMIIAGHLMGQGILPNLPSNFHISFVASCICGCSRVAVTIFLLVGAYFMVDSKFKASRVLKLYGQLAFWLLTLTWLGGVFYPVSKKLMAWSLLPCLSGSLWFVSAYIALIMLAPFLNLCIKDKETNKVLVIVLFIFVCIQTTIHPFVDGWLDALMFFIFIYVLMFYFKHYYKAININKYVILILGISLYLGIRFAQYKMIISDNYNVNGYLAKKMSQFVSDYKTLPNLLIACSVFYFFIKTNIGSIKWINIFASSALTVYIIHQTPAFYPYLWTNIIKCPSWDYSNQLEVHIVITIILIYVLLSLIGILYNIIIEPLWESTKLYTKLVDGLNKWYSCLL